LLCPKLKLTIYATSHILKIYTQSNLTAPYGGQSIKGNNMINHPYKVGQEAARIERKKRAESRQAMVAAVVLFLIFSIVSHMEYTDCVKYGVC